MKIRLQGVGLKDAIEAKDLQVGDITIWNYGCKERVIEKSFSKTGKTVILKILSLESNGVFTRQMRVNTLVAIDLDFNKMCMDCVKLRNTCSGERKKYYTGCIFKEEG